MASEQAGSDQSISTKLIEELGKLHSA